MALLSNGLYDEKQIIEGCIRNDRKFQEMLYHLVNKKMFAVCWRYANDMDTAQDLLQEGFVKVYKGIDKYRGEGSFEGWIRRIFVNTCIENFRKRSNLYVVNEVEAVSFEYAGDNALQKLMKEDLMKIIQTLSPGYRTIFNLYVVEGYSHKEIADMLKISEGTSKSQLARAKFILQKKVSEASGIKINVNEPKTENL